MITLTAEGIAYSLKNQRRPIMIPGKITGKRRIIFVLSKERRAAMDGLIVQFKNQWAGRPPLVVQLAMELDLYYPNRLHDGSDEIVKDSLQAAGVLKNDRQLYKVTYQKFIDPQRPRVVVRLQEMEAPR